MLTKIFNFIKQHQADVVLAIAIALITITSYNLGKIMAYRSIKTPITITEPQDIGRPAVATNKEISNAKVQNLLETKSQTVVASKKSKSRLYHFLWCSGARNIAARNKITFLNETAAIAAGYTLAGNCRK